MGSSLNLRGYVNDVIGHVTIGFSIGHFLFLVLWRDVDTTCKQRSRSFSLVPIDLSCLSVVTFALGRTI